MKAIAEDMLASSGHANAGEGIRSIVRGSTLDEKKGRALEGLKETAALVNQ